MKKIFCICIIVLCLMMTSCRGNSNNISDNVSSDYNYSYEKPYKNNQGETETSDALKSKEKFIDNNSVEDLKSKNEYIAENKSSGTVKTESGKTQISKKSESKDIKEPDSKRTSETLSFEQEPDGQIIVYATENDAEIIADKIIEYINDYRNADGSSSAKKLSGLTRLAKYRSGQLVKNFAHDTADERIAATAVKYGEYIDTKLYGIDAEPYYCSHALEAIGMSGYIGTVDAVAENFATLTRNSPRHWKYVGNAEYKFIGIGLTYSNGRWYMDITVSNTDEYNIDN